MTTTKAKTAVTFPITLTEVMARAKEQRGAHLMERVYHALLAHDDTRAFLEASKPYAFDKGFTAVVPEADKWQRTARKAVINTIFAYAKRVTDGKTVQIPGRSGKLVLREQDMIPPTVQYGLGGGDAVDLSALAALHRVNSVGYTIDAAEVAGMVLDAERQQEWVHGEHPLQPYDADLKLLGVVADAPEDAALQLLELGDPDPQLRSRLERIERVTPDPMRQYDTFQACAWYVPDARRGQTISPRLLSAPLRDALRGALYVDGRWDTLGIPRAAKAEAFDRMISLWERVFEKRQPPVVAANTDDLVGKAAVMAAPRRQIPTVAVQLAGWEFGPASQTFQSCWAIPKGDDVQIAQADLSTLVSELVGAALTLGDAELLTRQLRRQRKPVSTLDQTWVKHNGLY